MQRERLFPASWIAVSALLVASAAYPLLSGTFDGTWQFFGGWGCAGLLSGTAVAIGARERQVARVGLVLSGTSLLVAMIGLALALTRGDLASLVIGAVLVPAYAAAIGAVAYQGRDALYPAGAGSPAMTSEGALPLDGGAAS